MELQRELVLYRPYNEQEERDRALLLDCLARFDNLFLRENELAHMTASAWVVNPARDRALMAYHRLYDSWAWLGGHADGEKNLLEAAMREVREESGLRRVRPVREAIYSLEALPVFGHMKGGRYVPSHLHLNVTYLLEAEESETLAIKPDENSAVGWFSLSEAEAASSEPWFRENIYRKLNEKLRTL